MPVFQGGLISSHIDQAKAKQMQALAQARATEYLLRRRVDDTRLRYQRALDALAILGRAQPNADDKTKVAKKKKSTTVAKAEPKSFFDVFNNGQQKH